jgi:acetylornithine/N-succinyldiaminopimelate aminotransferase
MQTYGRLPLVAEKGNGRTCIDENGKKYIDLGSGIGTNSLGYCDEDWANAVSEQAHKIQHTSNYYYTKVQSDFAEKLCTATGYDKIFFGNSGAEANECAIKLARKYSFDKYGKGRHNIITLVNSFHGRTLATLSATGQDSFHNYFFPFVEGFINAKANDIQNLKSKLDGTICAIMVEFIQGEGGVNPLDVEYIKEVERLCHENDILFIADEVQTGAGRTGAFLTSQLFGVKPDVTTMAKGLAGGVPIGACLTTNQFGDVLVKGTHGSTFGGNPLACAGGIAVIDKVATPQFLDDVKRKGEYIRERLSKCNEVENITGMGLMLGISLKTKKASDVLNEAFENGLLILTAKDKVRLLPPLNITYNELGLGLDILINILEK